MGYYANSILLVYCYSSRPWFILNKSSLDFYVFKTLCEFKQSISSWGFPEVLSFYLREQEQECCFYQLCSTCLFFQVDQVLPKGFRSPVIFSYFM